MFMSSRPDTPSPTPSTDPDEAERLVQEARKRLQAAASEKTAAELKRSVSEPLNCYGVKAPEVHRIGQELARQARSGGLALAMDVADPLWRSGILEEGMLADVVVSAMGRHIGGGEFDRFDQWVDALTNGANTDGLASHLITKALAAKPSLVARLLEWTGSSSCWRRRAAVVAFVPVVREGRFLTDALSVAERLMTDDDEVVQMGVGWMLKEAARLQADRVVEFLQAWKGKSSRLLLRTAAERMSPAHRAVILGS